MSPIAYVHKLANVIDPTASFLVKKLLLGCQKNKSGDSRCPILPSMLYKLVDHIHCVTSDMYIQVMLRCMFLIAFHCFLRIGEYTMTQCPQRLLMINQFSLVSYLTRSSTLTVARLHSGFHHLPVNIALSNHCYVICQSGVIHRVLYLYLEIRFPYHLVSFIPNLSLLLVSLVMTIQKSSLIVCYWSRYDSGIQRLF